MSRELHRDTDGRDAGFSTVTISRPRLPDSGQIKPTSVSGVVVEQGGCGFGEVGTGVPSADAKAQVCVVGAAAIVGSDELDGQPDGGPDAEGPDVAGYEFLSAGVQGGQQRLVVDFFVARKAVMEASSQRSPARR